MRRRATALAACVVLSLLGAPAAGAQTAYPVPTVTLITHSSPGGGSDVFLRTLAKHLAPKMGVSFAIENVTGGSGARAVARVAQAPADGSMLYATTPTYIQTTLLSKPQYGYDSLMPVVTVFYDPEVLYTRIQSPHRTLADAIGFARKNPGKARWGAANPASLERIAMERLNRVTQAKAIVVSYEGGRDQMLNVLNGTLDLGIGEIQEMVAQIDAGQVRLLAVLTANRLPGMPALPTAQEQGIDVVVTKFRGLAGPKNLPPNVLKAWSDGIKAVLADPAYQKEYLREGLVPAVMAHGEAAAFTAGFAGEVARSLRDLGVIK
ncbi:MAG TPA: tripartite tricarboxylate transporter substrate binding protein [Burkholderiales bacterium]|nr:tripartite tricarboxylate transporter substrate binding protein [Burkholderiales bacterium]